MTERLDNLILVDVFDNPIGTADKRRAHTVPLFAPGLLSVPHQ